MFDRNAFIISFSETFRTFFSPLTVFIWAAAIVVGVVAGPFGTLSAMGVALRVVFWGVVVTKAVTLGYASRATALALIGPDRPALFDFVAVFLMSVVFTPLIWLTGTVVQYMHGVEMPPMGLLFAYVFIVAGTVFILRRLIPGIEARGYHFFGGHTSEVSVETQPVLETRPKPRLCRRLDAEVKGEILRISGRDHHVEVVTSNGSQSLRLRLTDAIDEMEPIEGYCSHRSHWIARDAVVGTERENSHKLFLVLSNGDKVPVSRKYRPELEKAGLIN